MLCAAFFTLGGLIDWTGDGEPRRALILLPALFGMIGCALAITARGSAIWVRILWSIASLAVGLGVVPAAMVVIVYVSGP